MAYIDDFIAHPRTFMRNNIVIVNSTCNDYLSGKRDFTLKKIESMNGVSPEGTNMDVYSLRPHEGVGTIVEAFWCQYKKNAHLGVSLPGDSTAKLMFTFAMDGCTLATGSRTDGGGCMAHHVNCAEAGAAAKAWGEDAAAEQQRKLQRNIASSIVSNGSNVDPDDYMDPEKLPVPIPAGAKISTNTFGRLAQGNVWKFYTHQWYTVQGSRTNLRFIGSHRVI